MRSGSGSRRTADGGTLTCILGEGGGAGGRFWGRERERERAGKHERRERGKREEEDAYKKERRTSKSPLSFQLSRPLGKNTEEHRKRKAERGRAAGVSEREQGSEGGLKEVDELTNFAGLAGFSRARKHENP